MPNQLGKRYQCANCGAMVLCMKAGDGQVHCCDLPMEAVQPRQLPLFGLNAQQRACAPFCHSIACSGERR